MIKIEEPGDPDGDGGSFDMRHGFDFQNLQRNKRSVTLNLKSPDGVAIFKRMVEKADVLVENYRPDVKNRLGILTALLEREVSGEGQWVHTSLLQSMIAMLDFQAARWLMSGEVAEQAGNNHPTTVPVGAYKTADGMVVIAAVGGMFEKLCKTMGMTDVLTHPDYATPQLRQSHRDAPNELIEARTVTRRSQEWVDLLNEAGVPCGPIYSIDQMFDDPQIKEIGRDCPVRHPQLGEIHLVGQGVNLERTPWTMRTAPPDLGQHTDEVLKEFGYDAQQIAEFRDRRVV